MTVHARAAIALSAVAFAGLGRSVTLEAHRLDEYLQATRLSVALDRVSVEMDLTAGVAVAPSVFSAIDIDRNGEISAARRGRLPRQRPGAC